MGLFTAIVKGCTKKEPKAKAPEKAAPGDPIVMYVQGGSCYHYFDFCLDNSEKEIIRIRKSKAEKKGLRPCKRCEANL